MKSRDETLRLSANLLHGISLTCIFLILTVGFSTPLLLKDKRNPWHISGRLCIGWGVGLALPTLLLYWTSNQLIRVNQLIDAEERQQTYLLQTKVAGETAVFDQLMNFATQGATLMLQQNLNAVVPQPQKPELEPEIEPEILMSPAAEKLLIWMDENEMNEVDKTMAQRYPLKGLDSKQVETIFEELENLNVANVKREKMKNGRWRWTLSLMQEAEVEQVDPVEQIDPIETVEPELVDLN